MWNMSGTRLAGCDLLERIAQQSDPRVARFRAPLGPARSDNLGNTSGPSRLCLCTVAAEVTGPQNFVGAHTGCDRRAISLVVIATLCLGPGELHLACGAA